LRLQQKIIPIFIARSAVVGATGGVTPALEILTMEGEANKTEYMIAFGVVAMMALYVFIIGRCLRAA